MFRFLMGVIVGAMGYWAWQSFGRDLMGMGGDQGATTYSGYSGGANSSFSSTTGTSYGTGSDTAATQAAASSGATRPEGESGSSAGV